MAGGLTVDGHVRSVGCMSLLDPVLEGSAPNRMGMTVDRELDSLRMKRRGLSWACH